MYPYFDFQGVTFYSLWLGIVISAIVFLAHVWFAAKRERLHFSKFFFWLPTLIISLYILGKWAGLYFDAGILFPFRSLTTIKALLSPYGFNFHFVGLALGGLFARRKFFKKIYLKSELYKWVDVFFFSMMAACIPLGFFLLLGDTFIGKATDGWYGIVALLNDSAWTNFGRVFPLGIVVSSVSVLLYAGLYLCKYVVWPQDHKVRWYMGFALFFAACACIFLAEHYTRHLVLSVGSYTFDIKNYVALLISWLFFRKFISTFKKK